MRANPVKQKLAAGEAALGTWLSLGDLTAARLLARAGFDWLTLDLEHSPIDWSTAATIVAAIADAGCVPFVRVPEGSHVAIKRALDAGAFGLVVPMIETAEQATAAVRAAKYPPEGNRSVGGSHHALNFDAAGEEYFRSANDAIVIVLQIESPTGVANARAIMSVPGVDAILIGPNDLRYQMRAADGTFPTPEQHEAAIREVLAAGRETGVAVGLHVMSTEEAARRRDQGMRYLPVGSDLRMLTLEARRTVGELGLKPAKLAAAY